MESADSLKQKVLQENRLANRLGRAQTRLEAAERERIWAIASAHAQGGMVHFRPVLGNTRSTK